MVDRSSDGCPLKFFEKVIAFRFKRRHKVRVKRGHRQNYTVIRITAI